MKRITWRRILSIMAGCHLMLVTGCTSDTNSPGGAVVEAQRFEIEVGAAGYAPARVEATAGRPILLVFRRTTDDMCGASLVIPSLDVERALPLGTPVEIPVPAQAPGTIDFACAMDMMHGSIVVR